jgi:hypothetical protein
MFQRSVHDADATAELIEGCTAIEHVHPDTIGRAPRTAPRRFHGGALAFTLFCTICVTPSHPTPLRCSRAAYTRRSRKSGLAHSSIAITLDLYSQVLRQQDEAAARVDDVLRDAIKPPSQRKRVAFG